MLSRRTLVGTGLVAALPWSNVAAARQASSGFVLGTQTHFSQGWRLPWMDLARRLGTSDLRDGLKWSTIETRPGVYDFDLYRTDFLVKARRDGVRILLAIDPRHPGYDDGDTVFSAEGQRAYAEYLAALLDRYGDVVSGIEVGNEINTQGGMTGPAASRRAEAHVGLLRTIHRRLKPAHPDIPILGGSTNVIGTGFLEQIFAVGGLEVMDGVSVHPYRVDAEHVDVELAALEAAMRRHGRVVPIYAPEFGSELDRPEDASPLMLKMVAMMGAAGVRQAWWYALSDQRWFRNMGLYTQRQAPKPAGETFAMIQRLLLPGGRPERIATDDLSYLYRFGSAAAVLWGSSRALSVRGNGRAVDARGRSIPIPTRLEETPVVILGDVDVELGEPEMLADSFYQFGRAPWSYFAVPSDGSLLPLDWVHWDWTSYIGDRNLRPLGFNPRSLAPAGDGERPIEAVLRYTQPVKGRVRYTASLQHPRDRDGDGVVATLNGGSETLDTVVIVKGDASIERTLDLEAGETVDLHISPNRTYGGDSIRYRVVVSPLSP